MNQLYWVDLCSEECQENMWIVNMTHCLLLKMILQVNQKSCQFQELRPNTCIQLESLADKAFDPLHGGNAYWKLHRHFLEPRWLPIWTRRFLWTRLPWVLCSPWGRSEDVPWLLLQWPWQIGWPRLMPHRRPFHEDSPISISFLFMQNKMCNWRHSYPFTVLDFSLRNSSRSHQVPKNQ